MVTGTRPFHKPVNTADQSVSHFGKALPVAFKFLSIDTQTEEAVLKEPALWSRIAACHPDDVDADLPFSHRLARDNGWTVPFAQQVITEYQRFAYLSQLGQGMVTPSDEVDQAWHLHLTYTRHYWGPFKDALGGALHHMPTKGGPDQARLFRQTYAQTLDLYRAEFGEPPEDIWPDETIRFGRAPHFRRVNVREVWLLPKPGRPVFARAGLRRLAKIPVRVYGAVLALAAALFGTGLAMAHGTPEGDTYLEMANSMVWHWALEHTFWFAVGVFIIAAVLAALLNKAAGKSSGCGSGCGGGGDGGSGCGSGCGGCGS